MKALLALLASVSRDLPLVWPVNNLTHQFSESFKLTRLIAGERIVCLPAQPHASLIDLMRNATCVLTDSWAMRDEAVGLGVPCLMLGEPAKRFGNGPAGSAVHVGCSHLAANRAVWEIVYSGAGVPELPAAWDGRTAERIAALLAHESKRWRDTAKAVVFHSAEPP